MEALARAGEPQIEKSAKGEEWHLKLFKSLAHEISQPLTTLSGEAELALAASRTAMEYRMVLENSLVELDRLSEIVRRFRELAELENPAKIARVSVPDTLRKIEDLVVPVAQSLGVGLSVRLPYECYVMASADRCERALLKLVERALERSERGGCVRISTAVSRNSATLNIADDGPAVVPEQSAGTLDRRGSLEWAFARRFAESSGGTFTVESRAGQGCVVSLALPLSDAQNP